MHKIDTEHLFVFVYPDQATKKRTNVSSSRQVERSVIMSGVCCLNLRSFSFGGRDRHLGWAMQDLAQVHDLLAQSVVGFDVIGDFVAAV